MLHNLNGWIALMHLADAGSMILAAEAMNVEVSTISRLISGLEKALGRKLVCRNTRPTVLTENGQQALTQVRPIIEAYQVLLTNITKDSIEMVGRIRLSVVPGSLPNMLMPILLEFQKLYPQIEFTISSGRQISECLSGQVDVASVNGPIDESGLVILDRGHPAYIAVASPDYIKKYGFPDSPESLQHHAGFVYKGPVRPETNELVKNGETRPIKWKSSMQSSDILMIKKAVVNGLGIAVDIPLIHCHEELERGELIPILDGWHRPSSKASLVCSQSAWHIRRIRVFMQWYCERNRREFDALEKKARNLFGQFFSCYFD